MIELRADCGQLSFNKPPEALVAVRPDTNFSELMGLVLKAYWGDNIDSFHLGFFQFTKGLRVTQRPEWRPDDLAVRLVLGDENDDSDAYDDMLDDLEELGIPWGWTGNTTVEELGLKKGDSFWMLFDFGDEWWFRMRVEKVDDDDSVGDARIVKPAEGYSQYPMVDA